jgi:hypothetical protein
MTPIPRLEPGPHDLTVELATDIHEHDLADLCEATNAAIIEGGGFGWVQQQDRAALARHFRGVLMVPERTLFLARIDGVVVGSAQLVRLPKNNEAQAFARSSPMPTSRPTPAASAWRALVQRARSTRRAGHPVLEPRRAGLGSASSITLCERLGYTSWGTHPAYARVEGRTGRGRPRLTSWSSPVRGRSNGTADGGA